MPRQPFSLTRRRFLETTGVVAGLAPFAACARSTPAAPPAPAGPAGAPGVELFTGPAALPDYSRDLPEYLVRLAREARERRQAVINAIATPDAVRERQRTVVGELWRMLGGPLERTPLNPRVTGTVEREGYRIEKVVFESRPRLFVTANLYVPSRPGRHPAILGPLGHSLNGKAWPSYQRLFINLARKGYVVLAYDPFGQGERIEFPGARPGLTALGGGGTSEHEYAGRRLILLGANFGLFRTWDGIRGIDYLLTRPEVDPDRVGCCGQSGGGTLTQFLAALDDRIKVAVVSQGNTENLAHAEVEPPGAADDAEQNIVPGLARGIDRADLLYAFAPKPLLMAITLHDAGHTYSPEYVDSSVELAEEYRRAYALFDAADRVRLMASTGRHGYAYEMRRATYGWFNRWFDMADAGDEETSQAVEQDATLFVTPTGFVTTSLGGETALSLTASLAGRVSAPPAGSAEELAARVRRVLAIDETRAEAPTARTLARIRKPGYRAEQFEVTTEAGIRVPGWLLAPDDAGGATPTALYLGEPAAWTSAAEDGFLERLVLGGGCRVAVIDVRGRGDMAIGYPSRGRHYFPNRITNEGYLTWFTLWLGRPLLGGQVHDVMMVLRYLRSRPDLTSAPVALVGDGPHGIATLFAAALDPLVPRVLLRQTIADYRSLATAERYTQPFGIYAYGLLTAFDLPDLAAAMAPRPVYFLDPVAPDGQPAAPRARELYAAVESVAVHTTGAADDLATHVARFLTQSS